VTITPHVRAHREILRDGQVLENVTALGTARDPGGEDVGRLTSLDLAAVEEDAALRRGQEPRDGAQGRRLAGAIGTDDADQLAGPDLEVDPAQRRDRP
jgi:hypothetical protein